jgi:diguanylate cyclase (GGDEF)-like protein/PAS domain S-box-containing protein
MKQYLHHSVGIILVLPLLLFFFYKSIISNNPFDGLAATTNELESLQVKLHRDILRYRNNQIRQYDTLNETVKNISSVNDDINIPVTTGANPELIDKLAQLKKSVAEQSSLIEDFKTSNSVLQNSLFYYSRLHSEIQTFTGSDENDAVSPNLLGQLSSLILQYTREPEHETALKIYPLLDKLNISPNTETNTLINHSLIIIEKLPLIDDIIETFNSVNIEHQVKAVERLLMEHQATLDQHSRIYNSLLFFCSLYLLGHLGYMFLILRQNKNTLLVANSKLNREVEERIKTEKTLYRLVKETASISDRDYVYSILHALYKSLGYKYAYISLISDNKNKASVCGIMDSGDYQLNIDYNLEDTPCEEVLHNGRVVYNRDFRNYFPNWSKSFLPQAESYIGITIKNENDKVIGLLAVADDKPINNSNLAENILSLAASRTSTELLRQNAQKDRERYHTGLESIDNWLFELIACAGDTGRFYEKVCRAAGEIANASMSLVPLVDKSGEHYAYVAASGHNSASLKGVSHALADGHLCAWSMSNRKTLRLNDIALDIRTKREFINQFHVKTALITPILLNDDIHGGIAVFRDTVPFDHIDEQLINQFAQRVQLAIANMQLVNAIAAEKERAEFTLHSIGDAVITTDTNGDIEYMNHIAERLTGWTLESVKQKPVQTVFRILDQDTREPMHNVIEACLTEGTSISKSMTILISSNGTERSIESSMSPIANSKGATEGTVIVFHDETVRRHMENVIHHQATHDSLTGLVNRHQFNIELKELVLHARNHDSRHVLCHLDLDRFKVVNDSCGHAAGDELLKQVSSLLHNCIRSGDILGRLGGDEFGLLLHNCPVDIAGEIADKIIKRISEYEFTWEDNTFTIGVSIGIVPVTAQTESITVAMKHADAACYTAKDKGRNRSYIYDQQDGELINRNEELHWTSRISSALEQNRFRLHAQSIQPVDHHSCNKAHIEILVRMEDENGYLIPPSSFIPAAERYNLMGAVDQHIIRETFRFMESNSTEDVCYSINLSGNSLNDDNFAFFIKQCLNEFDIEPDHVCFDIMETCAIANHVKTKNLIEELQIAGCKFALDDFGSGPSSLNYLKNLPVDYLKIDGSFVRGMVDSKIDYAMVAAINQIGHIMGIKTIAEFVENHEIAQKLLDLGVDFVQGYGISRPGPLTEATLQELHCLTSVKNGLFSAS